MKSEVIETVKCVLDANGATGETLNAIDSLLRGSVPRRKLVNAREAMAILGVSRPTLRRLVQTGKIEQIAPTPRKSRFDLNQIERLANYGGAQ